MPLTTMLHQCELDRPTGNPELDELLAEAEAGQERAVGDPHHDGACSWRWDGVQLWHRFGTNKWVKTSRIHPTPARIAALHSIMCKTTGMNNDKLAVLRELEIDRDAWRFTAKAFKVAHEYENELLQALRGLHATMAAHTDTPEEVLALDTAETLIAKAADVEPRSED